jgi:hypothetical protein
MRFGCRADFYKSTKSELRLVLKYNKKGVIIMIIEIEGNDGKKTVLTGIYSTRLDGAGFWIQETKETEPYLLKDYKTAVIKQGK